MVCLILPENLWNMCKNSTFHNVFLKTCWYHKASFRKFWHRYLGTARLPPPPQFYYKPLLKLCELLGLQSQLVNILIFLAEIKILVLKVLLFYSTPLKDFSPRAWQIVKKCYAALELTGDLEIE